MSIIDGTPPVRLGSFHLITFIDDDDIETAIRVRYVDVGVPRDPSIPEPSVEPSGSGVGPEVPMDVDADMGTNATGPSPSPSLPELEHGLTADGASAFCRHTSGGLVDCQACLEQAKTSLLRAMGAEERAAAEQILAGLHEAGSTGRTKEELLVSA